MRLHIISEEKFSSIDDLLDKKNNQDGKIDSNKNKNVNIKKNNITKIDPTPFSSTDKPRLKVSGIGPVVDNPNTPNKDERAEYGKTLNKIKTDKDNKSAVESGKDERMDAPTASVKTQVDAYKKGVASPATFKTNQRQTRELVKQQSKEIYPTISKDDLNKYSRSKKYTADDGKTQVDRSTVNTIAKFDMGPNIKKGDKLGVISGNMRKKYDMKASSFKPEAYDLLLDYVLSEGHADTVEEAHYVMTQMDEETIKSITEIALGTAAGVAGALTLGAMGINAIRKMNKNKEKFDKGDEFTKGSYLDNFQKKYHINFAEGIENLENRVKILKKNQIPVSYTHLTLPTKRIV